MCNSDTDTSRGGDAAPRLLHSMPEGHTSETNPHGSRPDPFDVDSQNLPGVLGDGLTRSVHAKGGKARERVALALASVPDSPWRSRVSRFVGCCSNPCAGVTSAGAVGAVWFRCRDRLCSTCSHHRAGQVKARAMAATQHADHLRFITLTLAHSDTPLIDQVKRLYECFQRLRRRPEWKKHVRGGMAVLEVKISEKDGLWHPHLHVLADGIYWHQGEISRVWHDVTGDTRVVDIRAVYSRKNAAGYVAKYGAKPPELEKWPLAKIAEYAAAIHRRRMVLTFGTLHGHKVDGDDEKERSYVEQAHVPIAAIEQRATNGCVLARSLLRALAASNAAYKLTLERRNARETVCPGRTSERDIRRSRAAMLALHRHWQRCPARFTLGGRSAAPQHVPPAHQARTKPPELTPPLDPTWLQSSRRNL